jgi:hypothetical protein
MHPQLLWQGFTLLQKWKEGDQWSTAEKEEIIFRGGVLRCFFLQALYRFFAKEARR